MLKTKSQTLNMLEGSILKNIIRYTVPIMLTSLLQLLFNAADLIIVGRYCGEISVAAVGNVASVTSLLVNLFVGFAAGTSVTVAQALGARRDKEVQRIVHTAIPTALISGVLVTIIGLVCAEPILKQMNTPETVFPLSMVYLRIYFSGAIFLMLYNFCAAILRAAGDTKTPLIFLTIGGIVNVVLNVIFVTIFQMNVAGVALATTISQAVSALLVFHRMRKREHACRLIFSKMKIDKSYLLKIVYIGLPAGLQSALFSISNIMIQSSINPFGDILMSGNAAAGNIEGFIYIILNSFMQTALNFIGQNVGAEQYKRAKKIFGSCLGSVLAVGIVITSLVYLLGPALLSVYITDSPEAIQWGMVRLSCICFAYCICGMMEVTTGALRGMGAAIVPMLTSVLGVCGIRIVWIYTIFQLPQYHTPQCLYYSYPLSWTVTFLIQLFAFFLIYRKFSLRAAAKRMV